MMTDTHDGPNIVLCNLLMQSLLSQVQVVASGPHLVNDFTMLVRRWC